MGNHYGPADYRRWHEAKAKRARVIRRQLLDLLGGKCDVCGKSYPPLLQIDHVDGTTWCQRALSSIDRQFRYMREHKTGVRLRILCNACNKKYLPERL